MGTYRVGQPVELYCDTIVTDEGVPADPTSIILTLRRPDGTLEVHLVGDLTHVGVGEYVYVLVPPVGTGGTWVIRFEHSNPTDAHEWTIEVLESAIYGPDGQQARVGPCGAWTDYDDVNARHEIPADVTPEQVEQAILAASDVMFQLGGRRWPGVCDATVQITGWSSCMVPWPSAGVVGMRPGWSASGWWAGSGGFATCWCSGREIMLPGPVVAIDEIRVDGVALDETAYVVIDGNQLVRIDGSPWIIGELDDDIPRLEIDYSFGGAPPEIGRLAATVLASELLLGIAGDANCRLDRRARSVTREGVSMDYALPGLADSLAGGQTGIPEVDLFVLAHNRHHLRRPARFIGLDPAPQVTRRQ